VTSLVFFQRSGLGDFGNPELPSATKTYLTVSTNMDPKQKAKAT